MSLLCLEGQRTVFGHALMNLLTLWEPDLGTVRKMKYEGRSMLPRQICIGPNWAIGYGFVRLNRTSSICKAQKYMKSGSAQENAKSSQHYLAKIRLARWFANKNNHGATTNHCFTSRVWLFKDKRTVLTSKLPSTFESHARHGIESLNMLAHAISSRGSWKIGSTDRLFCTTWRVIMFTSIRLHRTMLILLPN